MPESVQRDPGRWRVDAWGLRTKVAVVLVVPAVVALVLGGIRVQGQLEEANRLSNVRDQLNVLNETFDLADLVSAEMVAAVAVPPATDFNRRRTAVDTQAAEVQEAADFAELPAEVSRRLSDALGRLSAMRQQATDEDTDPVTKAYGYREVIAGLGELLPSVVQVARDEDLDDRAAVLMSMLLLRSALSGEEALIQSGGGGTVTADVAASTQHSAAEEAVLTDQIALDIPAVDLPEFTSATRSWSARRDELQAAIAANRTADFQNLLPDLQAESSALRPIMQDKFTELADTVSARTNSARADALRDAALVIAALLAALAVALAVARALLLPVRRLRSAALAAAHEQLPRAVERVRAGERVDWKAVERVAVHTDEEIGQVARAFDDMHQQAVRLAGEQAELRRQVSEMFMTLSRRSQSLVELQLDVIEGLEADEQDPRRLEGLFRLDHLATRLRRNGENLQVLAGGVPPKRGNRPIGVVELLRAATSEVNDYRRVTLGHAPNAAVRASAAADIVHILAELLENAARFSPPDRKVILTADRGADGGLMFEVVDAGLGMAPEDLAAANERLAASDVVGPETTRRMGLFVVSQLAGRHGVTVRLRPTYDTANQAGVTASVHVPSSFVLADGSPETGLLPRATPPAALPAAPRPAEPSAPAPMRPIRLDTPPTPLPAPRPVSPPVSLLVPPIPAPTNGHSISWFTPVIEVDEDEEGAPADAGWLTPSVPALMAPPDTRETEEPARPAETEEPAKAPEPGDPVDAPTIRTTAAGLPMRKPGARSVPVKPTGEPAEPARATGFRDPEAIRSNLSRHYSGMQAARRTREESEPTAAPERQK
ncbi:MAG TPA: ATP-binding protein [Actinophytocola sp.]|nr:ATP-binding protein [Actinophytocola sp.]